VLCVETRRDYAVAGGKAAFATCGLNPGAPGLKPAAEAAGEKSGLGPERPCVPGSSVVATPGIEGFYKERSLPARLG